MVKASVWAFWRRKRNKFEEVNGYHQHCRAVTETILEAAVDDTRRRVREALEGDWGLDGPPDAVTGVIHIDCRSRD